MKDWWNTKWHLPRPVRACCCIPLRRGIIAIAYINLVVVLAAYFSFVIMDHIKWFALIFRSREQVQLKVARSRVTTISFVIIYVGGALAEIFMTVVNLIGLHRKDKKLIRAYTMYTSVYTLLIFFTRAINFHVWVWQYELPILAIFLGFKFYYIMMLRAQVKKMEMKERVKETELELSRVEGAKNKEDDENIEDGHVSDGRLTDDEDTRDLEDDNRFADDTIQLV